MVNRRQFALILRTEIEQYMEGRVLRLLPCKSNFWTKKPWKGVCLGVIHPVELVCNDHYVERCEHRTPVLHKKPNQKNRRNMKASPIASLGSPCKYLDPTLWNGFPSARNPSPSPSSPTLDLRATLRVEQVKSKPEIEPADTMICLLVTCCRLSRALAKLVYPET